MNKKILIIALITVLIGGVVTLFYVKQQSTELKSTQHELVTTQKTLQTVVIDNKKLLAKVTNLKEDLDGAIEIVNNLKNVKYKFIYLGEFKLTHYCVEKTAHICGTGSGKTATGTEVTAGRTIAVDPTVIPYGTEVYIEGYGFRTAEDCGGGVKQKHIDIAVNTHDEANKLGTKKGGVWVLVKK